MSEHKPLPWEVTEVGAGEFFIVKFEPGGDGWEHSVGEIGFREDADFIVRCCNAHDDLLAACKLALPFAESQEGGMFDHRGDKAAIAIRAAIARDESK